MSFLKVWWKMNVCPSEVAKLVVFETNVTVRAFATYMVVFV